MANFDRFKCSYTTVENMVGFNVGKVIMYHPTNGYSFWDTSATNNAKRFNGIIFDKDNFSFLAALKGVFPTNLADGTYYCDSNGDIVGTLPGGSFAHTLGFVKDGLFKICEPIVKTSVGAINWGDIGGTLSDQSDLNAALAPIGVSLPYRGTTDPTAGWLIEDGRALSRTTYSTLFALIGTTYGVGDGSTTFNIPDSRGYIHAHKATSGTGSTMGGTFGSYDHTHSIPALTGTTDSQGAHNHGGNTGATGSVDSGLLGVFVTAAPDNHSHSISSDGVHTHSVTTSTNTTGGGNPPVMVGTNIIRVQ